ncbi:hypothetical protein [Endozoicomonas sp. ONNA2]|uniref:hypothetical protein n=1 Tax=Endozoicomonas sp. ONNA2 TaxID=2828741 RepID=UPI0021491BD9|nr:hypothetical protein [Endozoicomonas sp. ONNA2]
MTPTRASISSLSNNLSELTTQSEDQFTSNDCSAPFEGKQVSVADKKKTGFCHTMVLTRSAILEPPYNADHYPTDQFKKVSLFEYSVITAVQQADPKMKLKEIFCATDKSAAHVSDVFRRMMNMAYTQNQLSLVKEVAELPQANAYLAELLSGNHPHPIEQAKFLMQAGVDPDAGASSGQQSPLHVAVENLKGEAYPEDVEAAFTGRKREEYHNRMKRYVGVAKALLDAGAKPDLRNEYGSTPLQLFARRTICEETRPYSFELFNYLLNTAKADPDGNTTGKKTPL